MGARGYRARLTAVDCFRGCYVELALDVERGRGVSRSWGKRRGMTIFECGKTDGILKMVFSLLSNCYAVSDSIDDPLSTFET